MDLNLGEFLVDFNHDGVAAFLEFREIFSRARVRVRVKVRVRVRVRGRVRVRLRISDRIKLKRSPKVCVCGESG